MGRKTRVMAKKRLDKFYRLAKDEGYKSRAAFKLIQINREYNFLGNCQCLIDLCAAPGGWTQVAAKFMPLSSQIIAVDMVKMKPIPGVVTIQSDITTQKCKFEIKKHLHGYEVDAMIHDGAPNVTGAWSKDAYGQCELTLNALKLTTQFLKCGGIFITKIFRSADYNSLLWVMQQLFDNVTSFKPIASRQSSAEIYLICQNYLAPKKIDPRLLDPKFVFREIKEKKDKISVMQRKKSRKNKPSRDGYDQDGLLYKTTSIMDFINSETPEVILGEYNKFIFDINDNKESKLLFEHTATNEEIGELFNDLQLLAKSDFRRLLKWRLKMIKYVQSLSGETNEDDDNKEDDGIKKMEYTQEELDNLEDETLEADVREMFEKKKREKRKQKRKIRQAKIKSTRTMMMGGIKPGDVWEIGKEEQEGQGLFSLSKFKDAKQLKDFMDTKHTVILPPKIKKQPKIKTFIDEFVDSDQEIEVEESRLDALYQRYKKNHGIRSKKEERKIIKDGIGLQSDDDFSDIDSNDDDDDVSADDEDEEEEMDDIEMNENDVDEIQNKINQNDDNIDGGGLIVEQEEFALKEDSKMTKAKRWFSNSIFDDIEIDEKLDEEEMNKTFGDLIDKKQEKEKEKETETEKDKVDIDDDGDFEIVPQKGRKKNDSKKKNNNDDEDDEDKKLKYKDLPEILKLPYRVRRKMEKMNRDHRRRLARDEEKRKERDCLFEEVPIDVGDESTDSEGIAEIQAIGSKMLKKKTRMDIINNSYYRYAFDDDGCSIPQWFKDDESSNYNINLPVTKEEVREYKERLKAINARPIKKVAEAKARKKLRAQRIWNRIKRQATAIADNNELGEKTKIKQIEKLYAKKLYKKKKDKVLMLTTGGRAARPANGKKPPKNAPKSYVDRRLKADKMGTKHAKKRKLIGKMKKSVRRQRNAKNKRRKR